MTHPMTDAAGIAKGLSSRDQARRDLKYLIACGHVTLSSSLTLVSSDPDANKLRRRMDTLVMLELAHTHRKTSPGRVAYEPTPIGRAVDELLTTVPAPATQPEKE